MVKRWPLLDVPYGSDEAIVKRAYAAKLKQTRPDDDPDGFARLRAEYEAALGAGRLVFPAVRIATNAVADVPPRASSASAIASDAATDEPSPDDALGADVLDELERALAHAKNTGETRRLVRAYEAARTGPLLLDRAAQLDIERQLAQIFLNDPRMPWYHVQQVAIHYGWLDAGNPVPWSAAVMQRIAAAQAAQTSTLTETAKRRRGSRFFWWVIWPIAWLGFQIAIHLAPH
jgi:hypothetical protein